MECAAVDKQRGEIPYGYCHCGCGQKTNARPKKEGKYLKGSPYRFITGHQHGDPQKRFWAKVAKSDAESCWEWTGSTNRGGYGMFYYKRIREAHRYAWLLFHGEHPGDMHVLHKCDNPKCVNPNHLFLGTHKDNMQDRSAKNRYIYGEQNHSSKLSREQVLLIKRVASTGKRIKAQLAREYGVNQSTISRIVSGKLWRRTE